MEQLFYSNSANDSKSLFYGNWKLEFAEGRGTLSPSEILQAQNISPIQFRKNVYKMQKHFSLLWKLLQCTEIFNIGFVRLAIIGLYCHIGNTKQRSLRGNGNFVRSLDETFVKRKTSIFLIKEIIKKFYDLIYVYINESRKCNHDLVFDFLYKRNRLLDKNEKQRLSLELKL